MKHFLSLILAQCVAMVVSGQYSFIKMYNATGTVQQDMHEISNGNMLLGSTFSSGFFDVRYIWIFAKHIQLSN